jgi:hypothetical protein
MTASGVAERFFALLRQMDAEATSRSGSGDATGLSDYGRHARRDLARPQNEVEWSKRLAQLLTSGGVPTSAEVEYPNQSHLPKRKRKRRDLRLQLDGSQTMSIEVKGAWSDYWGRRHITYRSYLLHPLVPRLDATKSHTVPFDLLKLSELRRPETDFVGQLLVGFETPDDPMAPDVETLSTLAGLSEWSESSDAWDSPTVSGQRVHCWFWQRAADGGWALPASLYSPGRVRAEPPYVLSDLNKNKADGPDIG